MKIWVPFLAVLLAGCTSEVGPTTTTSEIPTTAPLSTTSTTTSAIPGTAPVDTPPCLEGQLPFVEDGSAGVVSGSEGDASAIGQVSWVDHGSCERLIISYRTSAGAPAVDPPTVATLFIRQSAVLRLNIGISVTASAFKEQVVDSPLIDGVFVVKTPTGAVFADIHLADAAVARVINQSSPARTAVDLRPGGPQLTSKPLRAGETIVIEPLAGDVRYPFSISGYGLGDDAEIVGLLRSETATIEAPASVARRYDTWGAFTVLFTDGPAGLITVTVGGVEVELTAIR